MSHSHRLSVEISRLIDGEMSPEEERALRSRVDPTELREIEEIVRQERAASERLHAALRADEAEVLAWKRRARVAIDASDALTTAQADPPLRFGRLAAASAAAFLLGFGLWFLVAGTDREGSTNPPSLAHDETSSPSSSARGTEVVPSAAFVLDSSRSDFEPIPLPGEAVTPADSEEVGLSKRTWTRKIVLPDIVSQPPAGPSPTGASRDRDSANTRPAPAASRHRVILELERTESRLVRYNPDPWQ